MAEIKKQTIQIFLDELASKSATPGGGSAAALMGAQGAALISMVCNLTIGKPKFAEVEEGMRAALSRSEQLRAELTDLAQADIDVFNKLMSKYALPKETDDEKAARSREIQAVLKDATEVPLRCARACLEVIRLSKIVTAKGNLNVVSDAGAGLMAAYGALKTAELNVHINAAGLKDREYAESKLAELAQFLEGIDGEVEHIYQAVKMSI